MAVAKKIAPSTMSRSRQGFRQHRFAGSEREGAHLSLQQVSASTNLLTLALGLCASSPERQRQRWLSRVI